MKIIKSFILLTFVLTACADKGSLSAASGISSVDEAAFPDDDSTPNDDNDNDQSNNGGFKHSKKITVMTYNINGIPCMRKNLLSGILGLFGVDRCPTNTWESKNIDARMNKLIDFINGLQKSGKLPDVLLVQEAFRAKVFQVDDDAVNKLLDKSPYKYIANGPEARIDNAPDDIIKTIWKRDGLLNSGVIIFSKHPFAKADTVKFGKLCAKGLCNAEKGVLYTQIKVSGLPKTIDVFNTHHQSFTEEEAIRKKQNELMFDFMKKNDRSPWAIAGGDFNFKNTNAYQTFDQFMKGAKMDHAGLACLDDKKCKVVAGTKSKYVKGDVLDHQFFARNGNNVDIRPTRLQYGTVKMGNNDLSDHNYHTVEYTLYW